MRILLILIGIVAVAVTGLLFAAPALVDAADYRDEIERTASDALGQPVQINGALAFSILPTPRLSVRDVRVGPPRGGNDLKPLLEAPAMEFVFSLPDLLRGEVIADRLRVERPRLMLQTNLAGRRNHALDLSGTGAIRQIGFDGGELLLQDEKTGRSLAVADAAGDLNHDAARGVLSGGLTANWQGRAIQIEFRSTTLARAGFVVDMLLEDAGRVVFRGRVSESENWRAEGEIQLSSDDLRRFRDLSLLAPFGPEAVPVSLRGTAVVERGRIGLEGLDGLIGGLQAGGRADIAFLDRVAVDAALAMEQVRGGAVKAWFERLSGEALEPGPDGEGGTRWPLDLKLRADIGLVAFDDGFLRQVALSCAYRDGRLTVDRASALLPGGSDAAFSGDIRLTGGAFRLAGSIEAASDNLASLANWLGAPIAGEGHGRLRNMTASSQIVVSGGVAQFSEIDLRVDQSRVAGGVALALVKRPSFSANLSIDQINLNAYAPLLGEERPELRDIVGDLDRPALGFLTRFDTNLTLRAGRIIGGGAVVRNGFLDAALIGGVLEIKALEVADVDGAGLTLSGRIDAPDNPQMVLKGKLQAGDPSLLLRLAGLPGTERAAGLKGLVADFSIEGGLTDFGLDADVRSLELGGRVVGNIRDALRTPALDLDVSLSGSDAGSLGGALFPGRRWTSRLAGPVLVEAVLSGSSDALELKGKLDAMGARLDLEGALPDAGSAYDLQLRLRHGDGRGLAQAVWPEYRPRVPVSEPLDIVVRAEGDGDSVRFSDGEVTHGSDRVKGGVVFDWSGPRSQVRADLHEATLDLDSYLPESRYGAAAVASSDDRSLRWSRLPLPADGLLGWDGRVELGFETLRLFHYAIEDGQAVVSLDRGRIAIEKLLGSLGGGTMAVDAVFDIAEIPALELSAEIEGADPSSWLAPFTGVSAETMSGTGSLVLNARGRGVTPFDLVGSLTGQADLKNLDLMISGDESSFGGVQGKLTLTDGVLRSAAPLTGVYGNGDALLRGQVDLADWTAELEIESGPVRRLLSGRPDRLSGPPPS